MVHRPVARLKRLSRLILLIRLHPVAVQQADHPLQLGWPAQSRRWLAGPWRVSKAMAGQAPLACLQRSLAGRRSGRRLKQQTQQQHRLPGPVPRLQPVLPHRVCRLHWHLAGLEGARGQSAEQLREKLTGTAAANAALSANVEQALASALEQARRGDRVLVFGSFHTVTEALPLLQ